MTAWWRFGRDRSVKPSPRSADRTFAAVGYPKVGNTWLRITIGRYLAERYCLPEVPLMDPAEFDMLACVGSPVIGEFTHRPLEWTTQAAGDLSAETVLGPFAGTRVVLLTRYPLDAIVSHYMQERYRPGASYTGSLAEFALHPVYGLDKLIRFHEIWDEGRRQMPVLLWRYEDALADALSQLTRVLEFIGEPVDRAIAQRAVDGASFEKLRAMELSGELPRYKSSGFPIYATGELSNPNAFHNRSGVAGAYRNEIPGELIAGLEERVRTEIPPWYGYHGPPPPPPE